MLLILLYNELVDEASPRIVNFVNGGERVGSLAADGSEY